MIIVYRHVTFFKDTVVSTVNLRELHGYVTKHSDDLNDAGD